MHAQAVTRDRAEHEGERTRHIEIASVTRDAIEEAPAQTIIEVEGLNVWYGAKHVLKDVSLDLPMNRITAFVGPSGCGKSTALRSLNRLNDTIASCRTEGRMSLKGTDIRDRHVNVTALRRVVGMVFQQPNPFPMSIYENIALAIREHEPSIGKEELTRRVKLALRQADLLDELEGDLRRSALSLSGGQQQRLCIARAIAVQPTVLMLDEPCASLDPISTAAIEELLLELRKEYTIVIVTHNLAQAHRISDRCAFFLMGELVEYGDTDAVFMNPERDETARYLSGVFG
jgi:phosphate transport system ATP-binding protein